MGGSAAEIVFIRCHKYEENDRIFLSDIGQGINNNHELTGRTCLPFWNSVFDASEIHRKKSKRALCQ